MSTLSKHPLKAITMGLCCFHLAYEIPSLSLLIFGYLAALACLTQVEKPRQAFFFGLLVGYGVVIPQLWFFTGLFKTGAFTLWTVLAAWVGLFVLLGQRVCQRWKRRGIWLLPVLWMGLEFTRSELYYLRFAWLTPGLALEDVRWHGLLAGGQYAIGLIGMTLAVLMMRRPCWAAAAAVCTLGLVATWSPQVDRSEQELHIVGVQVEFPDEGQVVKGLERAYAAAPQAELFVLPEYSLQGDVPEKVRDWVRAHAKHLIIGGKAYADPSRDEFDNTAFVVGPTGETLFEQVKAVPIQFFKDGRPATTQQVWDSPWGKIGIAICYDFSFTKVIDPLVKQGAQLLIIPTMDVVDWGQHQHELHSRLGPIRAREYGLPVVRAASSGVSQIISAEGEMLASVPFGEHMAIMHATVSLPEKGGMPMDRALARVATVTTLFVAAYLLWAAGAAMWVVRRRKPVPIAVPAPS